MGNNIGKSSLLTQKVYKKPKIYIYIYIYNLNKYLPYILFCCLSYQKKKFNTNRFVNYVLNKYTLHPRLTTSEKACIFWSSSNSSTTNS